MVPVILAVVLEGWASGQLHTLSALPSGKVHITLNMRLGGETCSHACDKKRNFLLLGMEP
jgi:hypothetical protein